MAIGACLLGLTACPGTALPASSAPEPTVQAEPAPVCGVDARFEDFAWVPADARLVTLVERSDPQLPAALTTLAGLADDPAVQLPVFAALDYRNLATQLNLFEGVLAQLGLAPAQLMEVQGPAGELAWLWPTDCSRERVAGVLLETFGVLVRVDLDHPRVRLGTGSSERFPFDLITLGERHVALTLAGQGRRVGAWIDEGGAREDPDAPLPGEALAELEAAPLRAVLHGTALLSATPADPANAASSQVRRFRVLGSSWEDLSLPPKSGSEGHDPPSETGDST